MFISGTSRNQLNLFEEKLDELISPDNPSRFIDAYVEKLDLTKIGFKIPGTNGGKGRPPYEPAMMLKIYIYGYLNRIRSSRKLEAECNRNVELMWLTGRLFPDFKTIADFRRDNKEGIKKIFREFLNLCHRLELLSKNLTEKLSKLNKSQNKIELIKQIFNENPELEIYFANDTDSRYMQDNKRINAGYNCQTAVDEKNKLIIAHDVTNESNDLHQLNNMKDRISDIKKDFKIEDKTIIVADAGYFEEKEILKAEEDESFEVYVSHPRDSQAQKTKSKEKEGKVPAKGFRKDDFKYDKESDTFECPEGIILKRDDNGYIDKRTGMRKYKYRCRECVQCSKRKLCTDSKDGRSIKVTEFFNEINEFREKCNSDIGKRLLAKRKEIVEHPFGTIKHNWSYRNFMQKGKETVSAEFSFIAFIYNFRRVLNIVEFNKLMTVLEVI